MNLKVVSVLTFVFVVSVFLHVFVLFLTEGDNVAACAIVWPIVAVFSSAVGRGMSRAEGCAWGTDVEMEDARIAKELEEA